MAVLSYGMLSDHAATIMRSVEQNILAHTLEKYDESYRQTMPGTRWEGCSPIPVLVNVPEELIPDLEWALMQLSRAAGREFYIYGTTSRTPSIAWARDGQRARPDDPYPAVVVAVANPRSTDMLRARDRGAAVANPAAGAYVTGAVVISDRTLERWPAGSNHMRRLLIHELGHLAGLAHAHESTIMDANVREDGPTGYTEGDLKGLSGQFDCRR